MKFDWSRTNGSENGTLGFAFPLGCTKRHGPHHSVQQLCPGIFLYTTTGKDHSLKQHAFPWFSLSNWVLGEMNFSAPSAKRKILTKAAIVDPLISKADGCQSNETIHSGHCNRAHNDINIPLHYMYVIPMTLNNDKLHVEWPKSYPYYRYRFVRIKSGLSGHTCWLISTHVCQWGLKQAKEM